MARGPLFSVEQLVIYIDNLDNDPYCLAGRVVEVRVPQNSQQEITYLVKSSGELRSETSTMPVFQISEFRESQLYAYDVIKSEVDQFLDLEAKS